MLDDDDASLTRPVLRRRRQQHDIARLVCPTRAEHHQPAGVYGATLKFDDDLGPLRPTTPSINLRVSRKVIVELETATALSEASASAARARPLEPSQAGGREASQGIGAEPRPTASEGGSSRERQKPRWRKFSATAADKSLANAADESSANAAPRARRRRNRRSRCGTGPRRKPRPRRRSFRRRRRTRRKTKTLRPKQSRSRMSRPPLRSPCRRKKPKRTSTLRT